MTTEHRPAPTRLRWSDFPAGFTAAVVLGVAFWFIGFTDTGMRTDSGVVTACWQYDYARVVFGILSAVLAVVGAIRWRSSRRAVPALVIAVLTIALVANGVLMALNGADVFPDVCGPLLGRTLEFPDPPPMPSFP